MVKFCRYQPGMIAHPPSSFKQADADMRVNTIDAEVRAEWSRGVAGGAEGQNSAPKFFLI